MIEVRDLRKSYGPTVAVDGLSFTVAPTASATATGSGFTHAIVSDGGAPGVPRARDSQDRSGA